MTLLEAIEQRLRDQAAASSLPVRQIGTSLRLAAVPAFVLQIVVDPRPQHFTGFQRVRPTTVQVDGWARTQAEADALGASAITALTPAALIGGIQFQRAMIAGSRGGPEPERSTGPARVPGELFRQSIDFIFTHDAT